MTKPANDKPVRRKTALTPYAVVWSMLGALGLGYLGVAIFAPDWLSDLTPAATRSDRQRAETEAAVMKLAADVDGLKSSMTQIQMDVAGIKADVVAQDRQTQMLGTQVSALEDKVRLSEPQAMATAGPPASSAGAPAAGPSAAGSGDVAAAANDAAPQPAKVINAPQLTLPIITGSVDTPPDSPKPKTAGSDVISFGPAIVKPAPKPIGVVVASDSSVDALRQSWSTLMERHGQTLKKLSPRYVENGDFKNPNFNLIAGPVKSKAEAAKICKDLIAHDVSCKVGEFKGEEL